MHIPKNALIVVADGEKALFLRNEDTGLIVETKETHDNPPTRDQAANRRGRMFDGTGHKSAVDDTDWHELAKDRFAANIAKMLYKRSHNGEIDKDLTNHPVEEIARIIGEA